MKKEEMKKKRRMGKGKDEEEKGGGLRVYEGHLDLQAQCVKSPRVEGHHCCLEERPVSFPAKP